MSSDDGRRVLSTLLVRFDVDHVLEISLNSESVNDPSHRDRHPELLVDVALITVPIDEG